MLSFSLFRSFASSTLRQALPLRSGPASLAASSSTLGAVRCVHSHRQIKRIFNNNPARRRVLKKQGVNMEPHPIPEAQLTSFVVEDPVILHNGWSKQAESRPEYPFSITRTQNKPKNTQGFLPIYSKYRRDGTKVVTVVKRIKGDMDFFLREIRALLQLAEPKNPRYNNIRIRTGDVIEIDGNHTRTIKLWLTGLGF